MIAAVKTPNQRRAPGTRRLRIRTFKLSGCMIVHQLRGRISNMYIVEQRRWWRRDRKTLTLVDLGLPAETVCLADYAAGLGGDVKEIFLTHSHHDHVGDLDLIKAKFPNAAISSTLPANESLGKRASLMLKQFPTAIGLLFRRRTGAADFGRFLKTPFDRLTMMNRFYEDGQLLVSNRRFVVLQTPGHTLHDASLYSRKHGILFSGDALARAGYREIVPILHRAERPDLLAATARRISQLSLSYFFPGFGPPVWAKDRSQRRKIQKRIATTG